MYNGQSSGQSAGRSSGQAQVVHVKVEDINIPFMHLVGLLLKVAIAAIPAAFIMFLFGLLVSALATVAVGALGAAVAAMWATIAAGLGR
jgi:Zn-dependent membrane protease YugP